jgi:hypothetical protein
VLATAARIAFRLERSTSVDASLAMAGIMPARQQILGRLLRHMWRREREELTAAASPIPTRHVSATLLGRVFFQRSVWGTTLPTTLPRRRSIIFSGIDRALLREWQRRWTSSETGAALREVLPTVGATWTPEDAGRGSRWDFTMTARFFTGHCHLGPFQTPWHEDEDLVGCPFCGDAFSRVHLVWECRGVAVEREQCLSGILPVDVGEWTVLVGRGAYRLGHFLRLVGQLLVSTEVGVE